MIKMLLLLHCAFPKHTNTHSTYQTLHLPFHKHRLVQLCLDCTDILLLLTLHNTNNETLNSVAVEIPQHGTQPDNQHYCNKHDNAQQVCAHNQSALLLKI
jgi:hypothetical protein